MARRGTPKGWKSTARKGTTKGAHIEPSIDSSRYTPSYLTLHPDPLPGVEMPKDAGAQAESPSS